MLLDLRDGIRNSKWLKYILVGVICVPFALVGIGSYLGNHGPDYAAKVNGQKVSYNTFESAHRQAQAEITQELGGRIPEGLNLGSMVNSRAMEAVVQQEVLRQSTAGKGFAIDDDYLANQLITAEAFQEDGTFSKDRYEAYLQSQGVSAAEFETQFRSTLLQRQFQLGVVGTGFALQDENELTQSLRSQQRDVSMITLNTQEKADSLEISDEEVNTYYNENTASFNNPEKVKVEYLELKIDDLKDTVEVSDEELAAYFEQTKSQWVTPEKRAASHILLAVDRDASTSDVEEKQTLANELVERINAGETLASIAPTVSDDPGSAENGGSLGEFGRGVMVPEFEEAVYSMNVGELSAPIRSDFGFHIIQLDDIVPEKGQTFEEIKDELKDQYQTEQAELKYSEASNLLANASYENNDSLQPAAEEAGLELQTSDWLDQNSLDGIGVHRQVLAAALSDDVLNNGSNSEVLEVGDNHAIVLRTIDHQEAEPKPVDEVREDIVKLVQNQKATEELQALADTLIGELEGGAEASVLASENGGEFSETVSVGRSDSELDRAVVQKLFTMPKPGSEGASYDKISSLDGNVVVLVFSGVGQDAEAETQEPAASSMPAYAELQSLMRAIQDAADIERNEMLLSPPEHQ